MLMKKLALLAAASLATAAVRRWWIGGPLAARRRGEEHREAVHRWEDEGGLVPGVEAQLPPVPSARGARRRVRAAS
ncbi:MAG TPA: hypothetical protein VJN44_07735 [Roseateles sp.]|nr:hypothetical protein [Roseateles sp.]